MKRIIITLTLSLTVANISALRGSEDPAFFVDFHQRLNSLYAEIVSNHETISWRDYEDRLEKIGYLKSKTNAESDACITKLEALLASPLPRSMQFSGSRGNTVALTSLGIFGEGKPKEISLRCLSILKRELGLQNILNDPYRSFRAVEAINILGYYNKDWSTSIAYECIDALVDFLKFAPTTLQRIEDLLAPSDTKFHELRAVIGDHQFQTLSSGISAYAEAAKMVFRIGEACTTYTEDFYIPYRELRIRLNDHCHSGDPWHAGTKFMDAFFL